MCGLPARISTKCTRKTHPPVENHQKVRFLRCAYGVLDFEYSISAVFAPFRSNFWLQKRDLALLRAFSGAKRSKNFQTYGSVISNSRMGTPLGAGGGWVGVGIAGGATGHLETGGTETAGDVAASIVAGRPTEDLASMETAPTHAPTERRGEHHRPTDDPSRDRPTEALGLR